MITIRMEERGDASAVRLVNECAFGQPDEAGIVERIREACPDIVSLVAVAEEGIVGHILFSPATIEGEGCTCEGMGLAPMAVLPEYQRKGIGSQLVRTGMDILRERSCPFVIVLGHPGYYPRFGFEQASARNVRCQWEGVPDEAFMIAILDEARMEGVSGVARYRDEFSG